jgi:hypothetical protein
MFGLGVLVSCDAGGLLLWAEVLYHRIVSDLESEGVNLAGFITAQICGNYGLIGCCLLPFTKLVKSIKLP